jgi:hypothetical protein
MSRRRRGFGRLTLIMRSKRSARYWEMLQAQERLDRIEGLTSCERTRLTANEAASRLKADLAARGKLRTV